LLSSRDGNTAKLNCSAGWIPVPARDGDERLLLRVARSEGATLAASLKAGQAVRSARKGEPVRVELDPQTLT